MLRHQYSRVQRFWLVQIWMVLLRYLHNANPTDDLSQRTLLYRPCLGCDLRPLHLDDGRALLVRGRCESPAHPIQKALPHVHQLLRQVPTSHSSVGRQERDTGQHQHDDAWGAKPAHTH